jgi:hypothetical protein
MDGDPDKYRAFAERCQRMADESLREDEKRQWLENGAHIVYWPNGRPAASRESS